MDTKVDIKIDTKVDIKIDIKVDTKVDIVQQVKHNNKRIFSLRSTLQRYKTASNWTNSGINWDIFNLYRHN